MAEAPLVGRPRTGLWPAREDGSGRAITVCRARPGLVVEDEVRRELAREARILALVGSHEAILTLIADASGEDPPRLVFEGGDLVPLTRVLEREPALGVAAALALVVPLAEALGEAHARGVVHGRVTPEVILVTARGTPKLVSWADAVAPGVEPPGAIDGSLADPSWLAPELLMGDVPTAAVDVHALGCLLARAATGRRPTAAELGTALPAPLARVIARATAKHPGDRHESAAELASALHDAAPGGVARSALLAALARRGLAAPARARPAPVAAGERPMPSVLPFLAILGGLAAWAGLIELVAGEPPPSAAGSASMPVAGHLRILAQPWAHVSLDGAPLDTTPIGEPVPVPPGRHVVDFVHPKAPKAQRIVEVRPGQTVVVDVILDVPVPAVDAGVDASP